MLEEEGHVVEGVEGDAVGQFDEVELGFLGQDVFDLGFEGWVGFEDFGADGALDGGFYFGFCAGGYAGRFVLERVGRAEGSGFGMMDGCVDAGDSKMWELAYSFLNMLKAGEELGCRSVYCIGKCLVSVMKRCPA